MTVEILERPSNSAAKVSLEGGEALTAEGGSMIAMSGDMNVETSISKNNKKGGGFGKLMKGLARTLAGEGLSEPIHRRSKRRRCLPGHLPARRYGGTGTGREP